MRAWGQGGAQGLFGGRLRAGGGGEREGDFRGAGGDRQWWGEE